MRVRTLQLIVLLVVGTIVGRLFYIQLIDDRYKDMANNNALRHVVQYPPRGEVRDRNGEFIVQSREAYDLMVIAREIPKEGFDTMRMCRVLGMEKAELVKQLTRAKTRSRVPIMITNQLSKEVKLRFDECNFRGFYTVYRTIRSYPRRIGGNLMGYVGEINAEQLRKHPEYRALYDKAFALAYAHIRDIPGMPQTPYMDEAFCDTQVWIWDSCFMSLFCQYAQEVFPGLETFNNFYEANFKGTHF